MSVSTQCMLQAFRDEKNWVWNGHRYFVRIVYTGHTYCMCPGNVHLWHLEIEDYLKEKVYTSELGIDWSYTHIAERSGYDIRRGIRVEMDEDLFRHAIESHVGSGPPDIDSSLSS